MNSATAVDLAVVGAGIVGLACALAAAKRGLTVAVIDRDERARGASVRNFGLVTLTGQERLVRQRASRAREVWAQVALEADIPILQRGQWVMARRPEAAAVLEAYLRTEMGEGCRLLSRAEAQRLCPQLAPQVLECVLSSPYELRVEPREALPRLAAWLTEAYGVSFRWSTEVRSITDGRLATSGGPVDAAAAIVCPGDDLENLYRERIRSRAIGRCRLQMLRVDHPGFRLPAPLMADLSMVRYGGFAHLPETQRLRERILAEQPEYLRHGIHLIVVQSADGSLVLGDSHHADAAEIHSHDEIERLILDEFRTVTGCSPPLVQARWTGTYATAAERPVFIDAPAPNIRLVMITQGVGASIGFAVGEDIVEQLFGAVLH